MAWFSLQEFSAAEGATELSIAGGDLAADRHDARSSFQRPAFEGGNSPRSCAASSQKSCRGSLGQTPRGRHRRWLDGAFAREEIELLRDGGARDIHERVQVDVAAGDAVGVEQVHALPEARDAVGIFVKSSRPIGFASKSNGA